MATITEDQLGELLNAMDDAIEYRYPDTSGCSACAEKEAEKPGKMCGDHEGDQEAYERYMALSVVLSNLAGRRPVCDLCGPEKFGIHGIGHAIPGYESERERLARFEASTPAFGGQDSNRAT
jgi:hypothetical protein